METPRQFADKIWGTKGMDENSLQEFKIPLSSAIDMIDKYCQLKDEAIDKASDLLDQYFENGGNFYGSAIYATKSLLNDAKTPRKELPSGKIPLK